MRSAQHTPKAQLEPAHTLAAIYLLLSACGTSASLEGEDMAAMQALLEDIRKVPTFGLTSYYNLNLGDGSRTFCAFHVY